MDIKKEVDLIEDELIKNRRFLHKNPELNNNTIISSNFVCKKLEEYKIPYIRDYGVKNSVIGFIQVDQPEEVLGFRADMDGLPIVEETGLSFSSKNGNMHACGHDGHTAALLSAGKIIMDNIEGLRKNIILIFQPGEEGSTGARPIVDQGLFEDFKIDRVFALHMGNMVAGENGKVYINPGPSMACSDRFMLRVMGQGGHGAYPHKTIDPITVGAHIITGLQEIISRELSPTSPGVISIGTFKAGNSYNIIPNYAELEGTVRAVTKEDRDYLSKRVGEVSKAIGQSFRAQVDYEYSFGPPPLINHRETSLGLLKPLREVLGEENVLVINRPSMGGEDFSEYLERVPGTMIFLENIKAVDGKIYPHHHPKFDLDEDYLKYGVAIFVKIAFT